jgi:ParB family chromosome partitioning protein
MQKRALGRGLGALFDLTLDRLDGDTRVVELEARTIRPNRYQPRQLFDDKAVQELAASIKSQGILQPVVVRKGNDGSYELIAGERRWRAARLAGVARIPAVVREASEVQMVELALAENLMRRDLNPIETARGYQRLIAEFKWTQEDVARRVGKDRASVANGLRLLQLPKDVQQMILEDRLTSGHAKAVLSVARPEDQVRLARKIGQEGWSVRQAEAYTRRVRVRPSSAAARRSAARLAEAEMEERLRRHLGTRVRIQAGTRGGRIVIEYFSESERERLIERILSA